MRKTRRRKNAKKRIDRVSIFELEKLRHHALNFGLGVQSTVMVLKVLKGELPPPTCIVFADPMWEVADSYENLERIKPMIHKSGIPFHIVSAGDIRNDPVKLGRVEMPMFVNASRYETIEGKMNLLIKDTTKAWKKEKKRREGLQQDLFEEELLSLEETIHIACTRFGEKVKAGEIKSGWMELNTSQIGRQCTEKYKIRAVMKMLREDYGATHKNPIGQWLGITTDEFTRMKVSPVKASILMYPLIDLGMSRDDCIEYCEQEGFPVPAKSACIGCPYHSNVTWNTLTPEQIEDVAEYEEQMIQMIASHPTLKYLPYFANAVRVHRDMRPIDDYPFRNKLLQIEPGESPCSGQAGCFL